MLLLEKLKILNFVLLPMINCFIQQLNQLISPKKVRGNITFGLYKIMHVTVRMHQTLSFVDCLRWKIEKQSDWKENKLDRN